MVGAEAGAGDYFGTETGSRWFSAGGAAAGGAGVEVRVGVRVRGAGGGAAVTRVSIDFTSSTGGIGSAGPVGNGGEGVVFCRRA